MLEGFNRIPGPRIAGASWLVWCWAIMVMLTQLQVGGMYGGVAQVMHLLIPAVPIWAWVAITFALTLALLLGGGYDRIERFSVFKVALFTVLTICAALVLIASPQYFSFTDMLAGLKPTLPAAGLATAIAVFGITGVGATELVMYPYWCVEKGYARYAGRRDGSPEWVERARGWIRVMHIDILLSLVIYTIATVAFYLLGAGVLHGMGVVPAAGDMIPVLSQHLHADARRLGALRVLRGRDRHALRHHLRGHRRARARLRRFDPPARRVSPPRLRTPHLLAQRVRRRVVHRAGVGVPVLQIAGADGRGRRHRAGGDAAADRPGDHLSAPPPTVRHPSKAADVRGAVRVGGGDGGRGARLSVAHVHALTG